ncbi:hypothetical protein QIS74_08522 [Colletotrichum tabaci]|uniref:Uncharacterized protein n=1 Tax=Colletotrichum tabaci TaxID=1209068 RepID=A0AAV9T889_9PEZI
MSKGPDCSSQALEPPNKRFNYECFKSRASRKFYVNSHNLSSLKYYLRLRHSTKPAVKSFIIIKHPECFVILVVIILAVFSFVFVIVNDSLSYSSDNTYLEFLVRLKLFIRHKLKPHSHRELKLLICHKLKPKLINHRELKLLICREH